MAMIEPSQRKNWRNADPGMLLITILLIGFGMLAIYSATARDLSFGSLTFKQGLFAIIGLVVMVALALIDYRMLRSFALPIYLGAIVLLVLVLRFGVTLGGAQRWFNLRVTTFQPSEPAKLAAIIALATFVALRGAHMRGPFSFVFSGVLIAIPAALIFIEPDLGTATIFIAIWVGMIAMSRTRLLYFVAVGILAVPAAIYFWERILQPYQHDRLLTFLHPEKYPEYGGFNILQARITIGQAGLVGHRFADTAQINEFQRLAVSESDFAFAHAIGNFGFIGALALFALYLLLIWRYLRVAALARDEFGQLIAIGAATLIFFQAFINIGMNVNLLPVVGIPLPFISAGGTPLVTTLATQGILQSILIHRQQRAFEARR